MQFLCKAAAYAGINSHHCHKRENIHALKADFHQHMAKHGLTYGTKEEFHFRLEQYALKDEYIKTVNAQQSSFTLGHNKFSTWTQDEFKMITGSKMNKQHAADAVYAETNVSDLPKAVDWRTKGVISPVRNQGQCGSSVVHAVVGIVESSFAIETGKLEDLSLMQLMCCDDKNYGCNDGSEENSYNYLQKHPLMLASEWPYSPSDSKCDKSMCAEADVKGKVKISSYVDVKPNSRDAMFAAIAKQPITANLEAATLVFQMYQGGILDSQDCGTEVDHAVDIVGYGADHGMKYYIVKNQWGADWGDHGYIKIAAMDGKGICGINENASYPVAASI